MNCNNEIEHPIPVVVGDILKSRCSFLGWGDRWSDSDFRQSILVGDHWSSPDDGERRQIGIPEPCWITNGDGLMMVIKTNMMMVFAWTMGKVGGQVKWEIATCVQKVKMLLAGILRGVYICQAG